ncbi:MAG: hypothetical protein BroJett020_02000 [Bacteroidota bacterium]|nr:MAG: hypothetical protein BroJett020_02000 [Bacteroidota bacterium]
MTKNKKIQFNRIKLTVWMASRINKALIELEKDTDNYLTNKKRNESINYKEM